MCPERPRHRWREGGWAGEAALLRLAVWAYPSGCPTHTWRRWALAQEEVGDEGDKIDGNTGGVDTCQVSSVLPTMIHVTPADSWFLQRLRIVTYFGLLAPQSPSPLYAERSASPSTGPRKGSEPASGWAGQGTVLTRWPRRGCSLPSRSSQSGGRDMYSLIHPLIHSCTHPINTVACLLRAVLQRPWDEQRRFLISGSFPGGEETNAKPRLRH